MPNVFATDFEHDDGAGRRANPVAQQSGAQRLGATVYALEPATAVSPYHLHHANEELLIVLEGTATVRTPHGDRIAKRGDVVSFPTGTDGAHQVRNDAAEPLRVLLVSTMLLPEVAEYPDDGTVLTMTGKSWSDGRIRRFSGE